MSKIMNLNKQKTSFASEKIRVQKQLASGMKYGTLTGLDKNLSRVIYGTLFLHQAESPMQLLDTIFAAGCNTFDCAAIYGGGQCETIMGQWLSARKIKAEDIVIITKGGCHNQDKLWAANISKAAIEKDLAASLARLQLSCLDIYLLHRDDPDMPIVDLVDTMDSLVQGGKIKVWGVSNWTPERLDAAIQYAKTAGKAAPAADSLQFSLAEPTRPVWPGTTYLRSPEERLQWYSSNNVAVFAYECLAKGFMAGKWSREDTPSEVDGRSPEEITEQLATNPEHWRDTQLKVAYLAEKNFDRRDRAAEMAKKKGVNLSQLALAYVMNQPAQTFALIGTTKIHHAKDAVGAAAIDLTPDEVALLAGTSLASALKRKSAEVSKVVVTKKAKVEAVELVEAEKSQILTHGAHSASNFGSGEGPHYATNFGGYGFDCYDDLGGISCNF